ncbi:MAG: hypothetical protein QMD86_01515 [Patescibacteria group bacterium]|nr:hypothetical protein [Patescibacteria group bacterium]
MDIQNNQNPQNTENKIPEPPPLEINVRTMESDLKAFKEGGGELSEIGTKKVFTPSPMEQQKPESGIPVSGYSGTEKPIFETTNLRSVSQEQKTSIQVQNGLSAVKITLFVIGIVIVIIGLGLLGYYIISPMIFNN